MEPSPLKPKLLADEELRQHVVAFAGVAVGALNSTDTGEAWNAAFDYAREHGLCSRDMTRVLSVLRSERRLLPQVLVDWMREGSIALGEQSTFVSPDMLTNRSIEEHAVSTRWTYGELVKELYAWADRFNLQFFGGQLPPPAISVARARPGVLGTYQLNRDGLGLKYRININSRHLGRGRVDVLRTVLHELVHEWEEVEHGRKHGGKYHTKTFRDKAEALGIPTDDRGHALGIAPDGAFIRLLKTVGLPPDEFKLAELGVRAAEVKPPTLQKWSCGCTNIWSSRGTNVQGTCELCERRWVRAHER